jgi:hypothetical protein
MPIHMAKAKTKSTAFRKLRKRAAKRAHKLTKKARKLATQTSAAVEKSVNEKRRSGKGKKPGRTTVPR